MKNTWIVSTVTYYDFARHKNIFIYPDAEFEDLKDLIENEFDFIHTDIEEAYVTTYSTLLQLATKYNEPDIFYLMEMSDKVTKLI